MQLWAKLVVLAISLFTASITRAQFTTIINVPPTSIGPDQSIGSHTQLNVTDLGVVGHDFSAGALGVASVNIELNISGGLVGSDFIAYDGVVVNLSGGTLSNFAYIDEGAVLNVSGGVVHPSVTIAGAANISGGIVGEMRVNGGVVSITGGTVNEFSAQHSNAVLNVSGGRLGEGLVQVNATFNVSGGVITGPLRLNQFSMTNFFGGDFRLNGEPIAGLASVGDSVPLVLATGSVLTGIFTDGTPFSFTSLDSDSLTHGLTLHSAALPAVGPAVIQASVDPVPLGVRGGQTLVVDSGAVVADNLRVGNGATVDITGGSVATDFEVHGAAINLSSGSIGEQFDAMQGAVLNMTGGTLARNAHARTGSEFNISGGTVQDSLTAYEGSRVVVSGGTIGGGTIAGLLGRTGSEVEITGGSFTGRAFLAGTSEISAGALSYLDVQNGGVADISGGDITSQLVHGQANIEGGHFGVTQTFSGGTINVSGGSWDDDFNVNAGGHATFLGNEFRLDDVPIAGLESVGDTVAINIPMGAVLSGTLADGTPVAFSSDDTDTFANGTVMLHATELAPIGPAEFHVPDDVTPSGLRAGQSLIVGAGGTVGRNFTAASGSEVTISDGAIGENFEAVGATVSISGGTVAGGFDLFRGSTLSISGGTITSMAAHRGTTTNFSGGAVNTISAFAESTVNVDGGTIGTSMTTNTGSVVDVNSGHVQQLTAGGEVNLQGGTIGTLQTTIGGRTMLAGGTIASLETTSISVATIDGANVTTLRARQLSTVNLVAGTVGDNAIADLGSRMNIAGGGIGNNFTAAAASVVTQTHGSIGDSINVLASGTFNIYGGTVGADFDADGGSTVHIFGTQFLVNGSDITGGMAYNVPLTIVNRNVPLTGFLADGSPFAFNLFNVNNAGQDFFSASAQLKLTRVLPGDFNMDGAVGAADYVAWRKLYATRYADSDYATWYAGFASNTGGQGGAAPEPEAVVLILIAAIAASGRGPCRT